MHRTSISYFTLCLLLAVASLLAGQSAAVDIDKVSESVEGYFRQKRPGWKHETAPPATPPGVQPSRDVAIHFWSSENCLTAEVRIDGASHGARPVPCRFKLAIDQSPSAAEARTRLSNFVLNEPSANATAIPAGDKGYIWRGNHVVFVKGKFTFWLDGGVDLRVGDFTINREFTERLAKDIADVVAAN